MNEDVYSMDGITNASNSCWSGDCIIVPDRSLGSTLPKSSFIHLFWCFPTQNHFQQYLTIQENILQKVIHGRSEIVSRNAASWGAAPRQNQKEKGQSLFLAKAALNPLTWHLYISHSAKPLLLTPVNKKTGESALPRKGKSACRVPCCKSNLTNGERIALLALRQKTLTR